MDILHYLTTPTPDGAFHIIFDDRGVARASGFGQVADLQKRLPAELQGVTREYEENHPYRQHVEAYYAGDATALDAIPRDQDGTDFQKQVWQVMSDIPYGETISYKQLAEASGNPAAVRAAGTVCGLNRLILLIPCHRVLRSDGSIGSYLYGAERKAALLEREKYYRF